MAMDSVISLLTCIVAKGLGRAPFPVDLYWGVVIAIDWGPQPCGPISFPSIGAVCYCFQRHGSKFLIAITAHHQF